MNVMVAEMPRGLRLPPLSMSRLPAGAREGGRGLSHALNVLFQAFLALYDCRGVEAARAESCTQDGLLKQAAAAREGAKNDTSSIRMYGLAEAYQQSAEYL